VWRSSPASTATPFTSAGFAKMVKCVIEVAGRGEARKVPRALNRAGPKLGEVVGDVIDHLSINGCRASGYGRCGRHPR
jgi:hypothetical protein